MPPKNSAIVPFALLSLATVAGPAIAADGTDWRITAIDGGPVINAPALRLDTDGTLSGTNGCNRISGRGAFIGGALALDGPLIATMMACAEAEISAQEWAISQTLDGTFATEFDAQTGTLQLLGAAHSLDLVPMPPAETGPEATAERAAPLPDTAYVRVTGLSGKLNIRAEATTAADVVARVDPETLLRNEGCEMGADRGWCRVGLTGGAVAGGWAAADFPAPAPALVRAEQGVFDRIGTLPCISAGEAGESLCDYGLARDATGHLALTIYETANATLVFGFDNGAWEAALRNGEPVASVRSELQEDSVTWEVSGSRFTLPRAVLAPPT